MPWSTVFLQCSVLFLKQGEGTSQIIVRMTLVMNEALLVAKNMRVSSTAICVFSKAFFCCSGIIAALAQFVACLVNFLVQLLKVFSLLLH